MKPMLFTMMFLICACLYLLPQTVLAADEQGSATYKWTDDSGTVNFTDNPENIPEQNINRAHKMESIKGESFPDRARENDTNHEAYRPRPRAVERELYGGHGEEWWRGRYFALREQIKYIKVGLLEKRARLRVLRKKKMMTDLAREPLEYAGDPRQNRLDYKKLYKKIKDDEEKIPVIEEQLEALEMEATRAGVPFAWRREETNSGPE